jgi:hypothetical protein
MSKVLALLGGILLGWWLERQWQQARRNKLRTAIQTAWENPDVGVPIPGGQIMVRSADPTTKKEVRPDDHNDSGRHQPFADRDDPRRVQDR